MKPQASAESYFSREYNTKARFCSYWHQIDEVQRLDPGSVLEVGLGNGFVSGYLRRRAVNLVTVDIDPNLNPDVVGSITHLPFGGGSFDVVTCYEVLEHIPYELFYRAVSELHRVCRFSVILSLPDSVRKARLKFQVYDILDFHANFRIPRIRKSVHKFDGQHHWEIGRYSYHLRRILTDIESAGFVVERTYYVPENPRHRFFILNKR